MLRSTASGLGVTFGAGTRCSARASLLRSTASGLGENLGAGAGRERFSSAARLASAASGLMKWRWLTGGGAAGCEGGGEGWVAAGGLAWVRDLAGWGGGGWPPQHAPADMPIAEAATGRLSVAPPIAAAAPRPTRLAALG